MENKPSPKFVINPNIKKTWNLTSECRLCLDCRNHNFLIIDTRFPYEFDSGHIKGAINIWDPVQIKKLFFNHENLLKNSCSLKYLKKKQKFSEKDLPFLYKKFFENECVINSQNTPVIIFHCEFSSKRGPDFYRLIRAVDRFINKYPRLNYPHIFLLEGGYSKFFKSYKDLCEPKEYKTMLDQKHKSELEFYSRMLRISNKLKNDIF